MWSVSRASGQPGLRGESLSQNVKNNKQTNWTRTDTAHTVSPPPPLAGSPCTEKSLGNQSSSPKLGQVWIRFVFLKYKSVSLLPYSSLPMVIYSCVCMRAHTQFLGDPRVDPCYQPVRRELLNPRQGRELCTLCWKGQRSNLVEKASPKHQAARSREPVHPPRSSPS